MPVLVSNLLRYFSIFRPTLAFFQLLRGLVVLQYSGGSEDPGDDSSTGSGVDAGGVMTAHDLFFGPVSGPG